MEKYSDGVKTAWEEAAKEAGHKKHQYIEKEHILLYICRNKCSTLRDVAKRFKTRLSKLQRQMENLLKVFKRGYSHPDGKVPRSPECRRVFARAEKLAGPGKEASCLHILAAVLEEQDGTISNVLQQMSVDTKKLREHVLSLPACTNQECRRYRVTAYLYAAAQKTTHHLGEIEAFILKLPHILHAVVISIFILLFGTAEGYLVVRGIIEGKEIFKIITHALIHTFLFSLIIYGGYIAYKRFIAPK